MSRPESLPPWLDAGTYSRQGWGQNDAVRAFESNDHYSRNVQHSPSQDNSDSSMHYYRDCAGPIDTWPTFRTITAAEWEVFDANCIVYTDGKNVEGIEPGWILCKLCEKKTHTKDLMHSHIESAKHQKNLQWHIQSLGSQITRPVPTPSTLPQLPQVTYTRAASYYQPTFSDRDKEVLSENRCVLEDEWIVCTLCNKKFMDMSFLPDHITTKKHRNNIEWANSVEGIKPSQPHITFDGGSKLPDGVVYRKDDLYCTHCDVLTSSMNVMNAHVDSKRHARHIERRNGRGDHLDLVNEWGIEERQGITVRELKRVGGKESPPREYRETRSVSEQKLHTNRALTNAPSPPRRRPSVPPLPTLAPPTLRVESIRETFSDVIDI